MLNKISYIFGNDISITMFVLMLSIFFRNKFTFVFLQFGIWLWVQVEPYDVLDVPFNGLQSFTPLPEFVCPLLLNFLDFLPHAQEFNHLLGIYSCCDELGNAHFVLLAQFAFYVINDRVSFLDLLLGHLVDNLLFLVRFSELGVDNGKSKIEEEERAEQNKRDVVQEQGWSVSFHHHLLLIRPSFQGNALEHVQKGVKNVVIVSNAVIRVFVRLPAKVASRTGCKVRAKHIIRVRSSILNADASHLELTRKQLTSSYGEYDEEKHQDEQGIFKQRNSTEQCLHQDLQTFNRRNCL